MYHDNKPPMNSSALRTAFSQFITGITVITTHTENNTPIGFTANSFNSVSLDPPLLLWSIAQTSKRHAIFTQAPYFAVHILAQTQRPLAERFSAQGDDFSNLDWHSATATQCPLLNGCLVRFECTRHSQHIAGDHTIIIGLITDFVSNVGKPLTYAQSQYINI